MKKTMAIMMMMAAVWAKAQVLQYDATRPESFTVGAGGGVVAWRPGRGATPGWATLSPLHGAESGWGVARRDVLAKGGWTAGHWTDYPWNGGVWVPGTFNKREVAVVSFGGEGAPSPMQFGEGGMAVAAVYAVVRCGEPSRLSTLLDAPVDVRLETPTAYSSAWELSRSQWVAGGDLGVGYHIDGAEGYGFAPSSAYRLVEARFETPPQLSDIFLGGSAPSPLWGRNWRGDIGELIVFPEEPPPEVANALRHYLSLKWGIPVPYSHAATSPAIILGALGISTGSFFPTLIIVR
jgi:hypothetical protein